MRIEAMVRINRDWAYVFDRPISFCYQKEKIDGTTYLIGRDGPFVTALYYQRSKGRNDRAFAGRTLNLISESGVRFRIKDHWWSTLPPFPGLASISWGTPEQLKKCYVFTGGATCDATVLNEMIEEYENRTKPPYGFPAGGFRYDYWEYEKVLQFNNLRREAIYTELKLKRDKKNLIAQCKRLAKENQS